MKSIGVEGLAVRLEEYLRWIRAGETVLLTEGNDVIAEIRPVRRRTTGELTFTKKLAELAERGEATLATRPKRIDLTEFLNAIPPADRIDLKAILDDLRRDSPG